MSAMQGKGQGILAKNVVWNLFGQVLPLLVGVVTIPIIVRGLGTDAYGILSIALIVLGYFSIFDLGLSRATVKFVAEHLTPDQIHKVPRLVWTSLALLSTAGCTAGVLAAALVPLTVTHYLKMPASFVGEAKTSLFILCLSLPVILSNDALRGVLEATQRFDLVNYVKIPGSVCFYLSAGVAAYFGLRVSGIIVILVLIRLATSFAYFSLCCHVIPGLKRDIGISWDALKPLMHFGGWVMVTNLTAPISGSLERFIMGAVLSVGVLTYYSVPLDLVSKVLIFPSALAPTLFPYFSYHSGRNARSVIEATTKSIKYLLLLMTPVTAVFVVFAHEILKLWLGSQFADRSTAVLQVSAVACFISAFAYIPYTSVQALGKPKWKALLDMVMLPTYALLAWWLMRQMGLNGAAVAKLVITAADGIVLFIFARKMNAFSLRDCLGGPVLRAQVVSGVFMLSVLVIGYYRPSLLLSGALVVICSLAYAAAFWAFAVEPSERGVIRRLLTGRFGAVEQAPDAGVVG